MTPQDKLGQQPQSNQISLDEWDEMVRDKYKIPKGLWKSMASQESGGDWDAMSPTGVKGKYQVTQSTAKQYGLNRDDPFEQTLAAAKYLRDQYDALKDQPEDNARWLGAVGRYYGGPSAVSSDGTISTKSPDGVSTPDKHIERVAKLWGQYEKGGEAPAAPATDFSGNAIVKDGHIQPPAQPVSQQQQVKFQSPRAPQIKSRGPVVPQAAPLSFGGDPTQQMMQDLAARPITNAVKRQQALQDVKAELRQEGQKAGKGYGKIARTLVGAGAPVVEMLSGVAALPGRAKELITGKPYDYTQPSVSNQLGGLADVMRGASNPENDQSLLSAENVGGALGTLASGMPLGGVAGKIVPGAGLIARGIRGAATGGATMAGLTAGQPVSTQQVLREAGAGAVTGSAADIVQPLGAALGRTGRGLTGGAVGAGSNMAQEALAGRTDAESLKRAGITGFAIGTATGLTTPKLSKIQKATGSPVTADANPSEPVPAPPAIRPEDLRARGKATPEAPIVPADQIFRDTVGGDQIPSDIAEKLPQKPAPLRSPTEPIANEFITPEGQSPIQDRIRRQEQARQAATPEKSGPIADKPTPEMQRAIESADRNREQVTTARDSGDVAGELEGLKGERASILAAKASISRKDAVGRSALEKRQSRVEAEIKQAEAAMRGKGKAVQEPVQQTPEQLAQEALANEPTADLTQDLVPTEREIDTGAMPEQPNAPMTEPIARPADVETSAARRPFGRRTGTPVPGEAQRVGPREGRKVTVNDSEVTLTPEQAKAWDDAEARHAETVRMLQEDTAIDPVDKAKLLKAEGMKHAARRREIAGALTDKEQAAKTKRESGNYKGKDVSVNGKRGKVVGNPFGRVKIEFEDGTVATVNADAVETAPAPESPKQPSRWGQRANVQPGRGERANIPVPRQQAESLSKEPTAPLTEPLQAAQPPEQNAPRTGVNTIYGRRSGTPLPGHREMPRMIEEAKARRDTEAQRAQQIERRRTEQESALKGIHGKFAEYAHKRTLPVHKADTSVAGEVNQEGNLRSLAEHPELRQLLDLPEMPPYHTEEGQYNPAWKNSAQDTLNALAMLGDKPRSSEMDIADLRGVYKRLSLEAKRRGQPISDDLKKTFADTVHSFGESQQNFGNFITDDRIDGLIRRVDNAKGQFNKAENAQVSRELRGIAKEYNISNYQIDNWYKQLKAESLARTGHGEARAAEQGAAAAESGIESGNRDVVQRRATGTTGRIADEAPAVSRPRPTLAKGDIGGENPAARPVAEVPGERPIRTAKPVAEPAAARAAETAAEPRAAEPVAETPQEAPKRPARKAAKPAAKSAVPKVGEKDLAAAGWAKQDANTFTHEDGRTMSRNQKSGKWEVGRPEGETRTYDTLREAAAAAIEQPAVKAADAPPTKMPDDVLIKQQPELPEDARPLPPMTKPVTIPDEAMPELQQPKRAAKPVAAKTEQAKARRAAKPKAAAKQAEATKTEQTAADLAASTGLSEDAVRAYKSRVALEAATDDIANLFINDSIETRSMLSKKANIFNWQAADIQDIAKWTKVIQKIDKTKADDKAPLFEAIAYAQDKKGQSSIESVLNGILESNAKASIKERAAQILKAAKPAEQPAPEVVKPTPQEQKTVAKAARGEKVSDRTGLTKTQEDYLIDTLKGNIGKLGDTGDLSSKPLTIEVPGDGKFTVANKRQANNLAVRVTGQPIIKEKEVTVKKQSFPKPQPPNTKVPSRKGLQSELTSGSPYYRGVDEAYYPFDQHDAGSKGWDGNKSTDGRYITDGHSMVLASETTDAKLKAKSSSSKATQSDKIDPTWKKVLAETKQEGTIDGVIQYHEAGDEAYAVVSAGDTSVLLDANILRRVTNATGADGVKIKDAESPVVITKQGKPVGMVMPLRAPDVIKSRIAELRATTQPEAAPAETGSLAETQAKRADLKARSPFKKQPKFVEEAEARLKDNASGKLAGSGAQALADQAIVTGYKVYKQGMAFADWTRQMIREFGDKVRPHLRQTWQKLTAAAKEFYRDEEGSVPASPGPPRRNRVTRATRENAEQRPSGYGGIRAEDLGTPTGKPPAPRREAAQQQGLGAITSEALRSPKAVQQQSEPKAGKPREPQTAQEYFDDLMKKGPWGNEKELAHTKAREEVHMALREAQANLARGKMTDEQASRVINAAQELMIAGNSMDDAAIRQAQKNLTHASRGLEDAGKLKRGAYAFGSGLKNSARIIQTLKYGTDISFAFRQAGPLTTNVFNTMDTLHAFVKAFRAVGSEAQAQKMHKVLESAPNYELARRSGLELTAFGAHEEVYAENAAMKLPWVKRTEAGNNTFIDYMRLQEFNKYAKRIDANPKLSEVQRVDAYKQAAGIINTLTGRTNLGHGRIKSMAEALNGIFGAPRLMVSRIKMADPTWLIREYRKNPEVGKEMLKQAIGVGSTWASLYALGTATGAFKVALDPRDKDFGKIVVGQTRYDITGGMTPIVKEIYKVGNYMAQSGLDAYYNTEDTAKEKGPAQRDAVESTKRFLRGRLGPLAAYAADLFVYGEDYNRRPVTLRGAVTPSDPNNVFWRTVPPLGIEQGIQSYQQEGWKGVGKTAPAEFFGIGANIYGDKATKSTATGSRRSATRRRATRRVKSIG